MILKDITMRKKILTLLLAFATLLGIPSFIFSGYSILSQDKKPNLVYEIVSKSNVFDIRNNLSDLKIYYKDSDLQSGKKNLQIIQLKISNTGKQSITLNSFDINYPLKFIIINGNIIDTPAITFASNEYLSNSIVLSNDSNSISFRPFILDYKDYFICNILILVNSNQDCDFTTSGKISNQKDIKIIQEPKVTKNESFLNKVFGGNFFVQITRAFTYSIMFGFLFYLFLFIIDSIIYELKKQKRKHNVKSFCKKNKIYDEVSKESLVAKFYIDYDFSYLIRFSELLTEYKDDINKLFDEIKDLQKERDELNKIRSKEVNILSPSHSIDSCWKYMENISLISKINENEYMINREQLSILKKIIKYIRDTSKDKETPEFRIF